MSTPVGHQETGLYIHWPYCEKICPYCDFNVARNRDVDVAKWRDVLFEDLKFWRGIAGPRTLQSIYFGGGTPSLMPPELIGGVVDEINQHFGTNEDIEITIEANPTNAEMSRLMEWQAAGINRLSLGVQSFDDDHLSFLGRNHDGASARRAVDRALQVFSSMTFDLIYGLPMETLEEWSVRVTDAAKIGAPHLSAYQLTIEPGTAFGKAVERNAWQPHNDDLLADFFYVTSAELRAAGYEHYEISNFCQPKKRAVHNSLYWQGADWIGIGPGAAGRLTTNLRSETNGRRNIGQFLRADIYDRYEIVPLTDEDVMIEHISGGMRVKEGIELSRVETRWPQMMVTAQQFELDGLMSIENNRMMLTQEGRLVADTIIRELISAV